MAMCMQRDITDEEFQAHFAQFGEMDDCVVRTAFYIYSAQYWHARAGHVQQPVCAATADSLR